MDSVVCTGGAAETECENDVDDDGDGKTDCADEDCADEVGVCIFPILPGQSARTITWAPRTSWSCSYAPSLTIGRNPPRAGAMAPAFSNSCKGNRLGLDPDVDALACWSLSDHLTIMAQSG